jgi:hypothetical protein
MNRFLTLISVVGLGLLAACGSEGTTSTESDAATEAPGDQADSSAEQTAPTSDEPAYVVQSGFTTFPAVDETYANMGALVQNNTDADLFFVEVTYTVIGADGTTVAIESSSIDYMPAGEAVATTEWTMTDLTAAMPVTLEVTALAEEGPPSDAVWAELDVTVVDSTVVLDDNGFGSFSGTITNTTDVEAEYYEVGCLVVDPDGSVLGGINGFGDTVAAGETATWSAEGINDFEAFADADGSVSNCRAFLWVS